LEVPVTYFFEDSGDKHFLSEVFLPYKDAQSKEFKEALKTTVSLFIIQQYETYFYSDSEVSKLRNETLKKDDDAFCKKMPNASASRACFVFFGVNLYFNIYNSIPDEIRNEVIAMINRINSEFFTEIKTNKSIYWLIKNDVFTETDLLQMVNNISLDYRKKQACLNE
jgi:hypothetical protein